jgi:2-hydroxychromene-2-carboxylate isomerase
MATIDWYFDVISPFAYLQCEQLKTIGVGHQIVAHPVLFAGLLNHWEHKGPAEIPAKRQFTYRYVTWYARRYGFPLRMPHAHPFNPIPALRLAVALGGDLDAIRAIFRYIWVDGLLPSDEPEWLALCQSLGVNSPATTLGTPEVKARLRTNTDAACDAGVFGVPTAVVDGELFWGVDATDMLLDYLKAPGEFLDDEIRRVSDLPTSASRV